MRVIKFRAWDEISKQMLLPGDGSNVCVTATGSACTDETSSGGTLENRSYRLKIMQFTGLTDTNGVEIYEGDILVDPEIPDVAYEKGTYAKGLVVFVDGEFSIQYKHSENTLCYEKIRKASVFYTVIGNIHQNPELLESDNV